MTIIGTYGATIAVFPFKVYDIINDKYIVSRRLAEAQTIERVSGVRCGPSVEVPRGAVDSDGFTDIDYLVASTAE